MSARQQKRLRAEAPWERAASGRLRGGWGDEGGGSQVNTRRAKCAGHRDPRATLEPCEQQERPTCVAPPCLRRSGRSRRFKELYPFTIISFFFEIKSWPARAFCLFFSHSRFVPQKMWVGGWVGGRWVGGVSKKKKRKKKKQSDASSFRGNRKRLKERDSGRPVPLEQ